MRRRVAGAWVSSLLATAIVFAQAPPQPAAPLPNKAVVSIIHLAGDKTEALRGNGFLISGDGLVVTNYHLVYGAAGFQIRLANGDIYDQANIRALDPVWDLAVLKIPAFNAPFLPLSEAIPESGPVTIVEQAVGQKKRGQSRQATLVSKAAVMEGMELLVLNAALDAQTKGCPVLDSAGACFGVSTLAFSSQSGGAVIVPIRRVAELLALKKMNRPLSLMDWSQWPSVIDAPVAERMAKAGVTYRPLPEGIRTDQSLRRRLTMALDFDPTDPKCRALLARVCMQEFDYEGAGAHVKELVAKWPDDPDVALLKADLLHHLGDFDAARAIYQRIVEEGYQTPANYDRDAKGVIMRNFLHDHALLYCKGPLIIGEDQLRFRPEDWVNDDFTTPLSNIAAVKLEIKPEAGQPLYKFEFKFARPVANWQGTWRKEDIQLRVIERETAENLKAYLEKRGIPVSVEEK